MIYNKLISLILLILVVAGNSPAQEILPKTAAVEILLEHNYNIKITKNNVELAENNASVLNSGYIPSFQGNAGTNISYGTSSVEYQDGRTQSTANAQTYSFNTSLGLSYTLFDGLGRKYNYSKQKENYTISELQMRRAIELNILDLFRIYYGVARLTTNEINQRETMDISRRRLERAQYGYEYGQSTQLDVLNAEVDYNTDSITYLNILLELENVKRDINVLLGRDVNTLFVVDTSIVYEKGIFLEDLMNEAMKNNVSLLLNQSFVQTSEYDININRSAMIPRLDLNASYQWNDRNNDATSLITSQTNYGPQAGINLSWNIFDGGTTKTRIQNAKISRDNELINLEQNTQILERNVNNAWSFYQNALFVLEAERKNLETNQRNFDRSVEQYQLGQISSIVFRQAQFNLLRANQNFNQAKYDAKIAELALLQLSGSLMYANF
jgi:outer membrane protein TolC